MTLMHNIVLPGLCLLWAAAPANAQATDPAADSLAAQLRMQGFKCSPPVKASPDPSRSKPDEEVWRLSCAERSYVMRLVPDMAARIEEQRE